MVKLVLVIVAMVVGSVVLSTVGLPVWLASVVSVGIGGIYLSISRPSTQQQVLVTSPGSDSTPTTESASEFSNVAFSEALPTWKGWKKEVGTVTVSSSAVTIVGRKTTLTVMAPFTAEVTVQKYSHWPMVKVDGAEESGQSSTVYLVVRGAPVSVGALTPELAQSESEVLASAINEASAT